MSNESATNGDKNKEVVINMSGLANLTPEEITELARELAKDMVDLGDVRISEQALKCVMCGIPQATYTSLLGGYNTILCQTHRNQWHTFVEDSPEAISYESANLRLEIAVRNGKEPEAITYFAGVKAAKKGLFELAKRWTESG